MATKLDGTAIGNELARTLAHMGMSRAQAGETLLREACFLLFRDGTPAATVADTVRRYFDEIAAAGVRSASSERLDS